ncbi:SUF system NifU family Fe-S cluster assembly protein [Alkalilimnicola ehrlichii]|uniref:SUF system NifU family Fe-S cluster assembly protein n=1 Tax=Alkalilimnicola ehrlichii TaxID=351052 RepID=A0A3E0X3E2_9GAMM|nr:SUF system NifU family Fe-S cluster assembly protein [Alkalilimnicola ehrlichii]RFA31059.1 SUF system NifU family Fe-S cluster assembly protein [Alkalilimnicola ehrlichii]RFA39015.1 SUF system NifU family Fe-S cluster assembly protein [Alkalilimnicola ehrlichii]
MSELSDLYQEVILDHNRKPRNFRAIDPCSHDAAGYNPLCGDQVHVYVNVEGDRIKEVGFQGEGCAISTASASIMTESLEGKTLAEAEALFQSFHALLVDSSRPLDANLGKLAVLAGVRDYPSRVKCATLAWHALHAALEGESEASSE